MQVSPISLLLIHVSPPKKQQDLDDETPLEEALRLDANCSNKHSAINLEEGGLWKYLAPDTDWMPWEMDVLKHILN